MGIIASIDISEEQRQILLDLLSKYLANTQVWAFGSRVKWTTRSNSDLDLVVFSSPEQDSHVSALKEALEESNLPFRVDLLVWDKLPENFQRNIEEGYVVLVEGDDVGRDGVISSNWVTKPISNIISMQRGHDLPSQDRNEGIVPIMGSSGITGYHNAIKANGPGVVIGRSGNSMGEVSFIKEDYWPLNTCLYVTDFKGNDERFIYYLLQTIDFDQFNSGSAQKSLNRNIVYPYEVSITECKNEQIKISKILSDLEDKIELNCQTNQTLEQIAQALFKSWFVDFEPVKAKIAAKQAGANAEQIEQAAICAISGKTPEQLAQLNPQILKQLKTTAALFPDALVDSELGEIPEGWDITVLGELLEFNPKRTLKSSTLAPYLDMKNVPIQGHLVDEVCLREMASGTKFINGDTLLARITPCLENGKTAYVDFLEKDQIGWGSTEFIVLRPRNGRPTSLGYIIARLDTFRAKAIQTMTGTSGRQRASAQAIAEQLWINYPIELLNIYDLVAGCHLKKAKSNGDENNILSKLRDSLLPKLLSGELDLSNWDEPTVFNRDVGTGRDLSLGLNSPNVE